MITPEAMRKMADRLDKVDCDNIVEAYEAAAMLRSIAAEREWQDMDSAPKDGTLFIAKGLMMYESDISEDEEKTILAKWAFNGWRPDGPTARGFRGFSPKKWHPLPKGAE